VNKFHPSWLQTQKQSGIRYRCGYCGTDTSPARGWNSENQNGHIGFVLLCTNCDRPSFVEMRGSKIESTTPAAMMGQDLNGLPSDVLALYEEARRCTSVGAFTSAVLTCRKILMHVAVEKGAAKGRPFIEYVDFLATNSYIPPDARGWVDHIRSKSNEANHEIAVMGQDEASDLVSFTEMLLRLVYEFKHRLSSSSQPPASP
jgi:hypothetical protein